MATTLTNMTTSVFAEAVVMGLKTKVVNLKGFSMSLDRDVSNSRAGTVIVPVLGDVEAAAFNETTNNYATGDTTDEGVSVTVDKHIVAKSKYTDRQLMTSPRDLLEKKGIKCGNAIGKKVVKDVLALITKATYSQEIKLAFADFNPERVAALVDEIAQLDLDPANCSLTLNGAMYSRLLGKLSVNQQGESVMDAKAGIIKGLYGFGQIVRADILKAATPNLLGFINAPEALAVGSQYVEPGSQKVYEETGMAYDDDAGIVVGIRRFGEASTGNNNIAVECLYGAAAINKKALVRLVAA